VQPALSPPPPSLYVRPSRPSSSAPIKPPLNRCAPDRICLQGTSPSCQTPMSLPRQRIWRASRGGVQRNEDLRTGSMGGGERGRGEWSWWGKGGLPTGGRGRTLSGTKSSTQEAAVATRRRPPVRAHMAICARVSGQVKTAETVEVSKQRAGNRITTSLTNQWLDQITPPSNPASYWMN